MEEIVEFENIIKELTSLFFNKGYEKYNNGWKLIYTIQGLTYNNYFYPNTKFIFWLNQDKNEIIENVITYLRNDKCEYVTVKLQENYFDIIMNDIKSIPDNININEFIVKGTDKFNELLNQLQITDFFSNLEYIPYGKGSCNDFKYKFKLTYNNGDVIPFDLYKDDNWKIDIKNETIELKLNEIHEKLVKHIYEIK